MKTPLWPFLDLIFTENTIIVHKTKNKLGLLIAQAESFDAWILLEKTKTFISEIKAKICQLSQFSKKFL